MSDDESNWCTIESDPGVFTSLIEAFEVSNVEMSELWSLDSYSMETLVQDFGKVHGLIFLFKWDGGNSDSKDESMGTAENKRCVLDGDAMPSDLFFARQVIHNACATQAILSVLFNAASSTTFQDTATDSNSENVRNSFRNDMHIQLGKNLDALKTFMSSLPPDLRGEALGASDDIRVAHNSFARRDMFAMDVSKKRKSSTSAEVFHFIAYVPHKDGHVYELDGLQAGPISVGTFDSSVVYDGGPFDSSDFLWLDVARAAIQERINKYAMTEIKFNLMAVVRDRRTGIKSKIDQILSSELVAGDERLEELRVQLNEEEAKRQRWNDENQRRRHNYLPLCFEILRAYAKSGKMPEMTRKAEEKMKQAKKKRM